MNSNLPPPTPTAWLLRIPELFHDFIPDIYQLLNVTSSTKLGSEYHLVKLPDPAKIKTQPASLFIPWNLPLHHSWPCNPQKMDGFIEKAALTLAGKFASYTPQNLLAAPLQPGQPNHYYKSLASNLRGRALQLFPPLTRPNAEDQDPHQPSLFCLVGQQGLFAGLQSPADSHGFHAGGTRYIKQSEETTISRAAAKIAEALHLAPLYHPLPPFGSRWLELGASPGGMTAELLNRHYRVTAIDRAPLETQLQGRRGLNIIRADVASFQPPTHHRYDALLCDLNGDPRLSIRHVTRLSPYLHPQSLIIFTMKTPGVEDFPQIINLHDEVLQIATQNQLKHLASTHLTYNRQEFTLLFTS